MSAETVLEVLATGALSLVQDAGRPGWAHLGVTASGAADEGAYRAANRLVGNEPGAAAIESVLGGLVLRARGTVLVAVTGAPCSVVIERRAPRVPIVHPAGCSLVLHDGEVLRIGIPAEGLRTVLAVRGGIDVEPVLGSRSSDVLSGIGPPALAVGDTLCVGGDAGEWPAADLLPAMIGWRPSRRLDVLRGPRDDLVGAPGWARLLEAEWVVSTASNRVGLRLHAADGRGIEIAETERAAVLPSEGMVVGAVQLPPGGEPVVFLRDHPVTGGYPVIAVLTSAAVDVAAQLRPGDVVGFAATRG